MAPAHRGARACHLSGRAGPLAPSFPWMLGPVSRLDPPNAAGVLGLHFPLQPPFSHLTDGARCSLRLPHREMKVPRPWSRLQGLPTEPLRGEGWCPLGVGAESQAATTSRFSSFTSCVLAQVLPQMLHSAPPLITCLFPSKNKAMKYIGRNSSIS